MKYSNKWTCDRHTFANDYSHNVAYQTTMPMNRVPAIGGDALMLIRLSLTGLDSTRLGSAGLIWIGGARCCSAGLTRLGSDRLGSAGLTRLRSDRLCSDGLTWIGCAGCGLYRPGSACRLCSVGASMAPKSYIRLRPHDRSFGARRACTTGGLATVSLKSVYPCSVWHSCTVKTCISENTIEHILTYICNPL
jgi:hypothetical protein